MNAGDNVFVVVNGTRVGGVFVRDIRKNRVRIAVKKEGWRRDHWVTVSTKKVSA